MKQPIEVTVFHGGIGMPCTVVPGVKTSRVYAMGFAELTFRSHPEQFIKALMAARDTLPQDGS